MTPGHNTDIWLDKEVHHMTKEQMGNENRELDELVKTYKIRIGNDIGKSSFTLAAEQIGELRKAALVVK